ncbi:MAG: phenylacetate--CoA ligase family protein [Flavobacteriaceae bacterium]|nr:phenylacetate--CoA ligase family protein [Flavobacteriaceae bacterium]
MRIFDLSLRLNGFHIKKAKIALETIKSIDANAFQVYVEDKKSAIVNYHLEHNKFYKSLGKTIDLDDWNSVPVMTKRDLQRPLEQRLSEGVSKDNCYINKTSGSSGDPFIFAKDKWSHALTWAVIQDRFGWYNINFNYSKQARFYGIPLDKKGYYKERLKDWFSNRYRFSVFDLSDASFERYLKAFSKTRFNYINGYTSVMVQFAKFLKRKNIILKDVCPSIAFCVVTSEMLFDSDKVLMEVQFGVPIVNEYGASELDLIAFQNPEQQWQINSETLYVEILDDDNVVLPYGQEGRIVITSLYNTAHPFIRYDIGDIGILSTKSTSKLPILKKLVGRTNDIIKLPSGKTSAGLSFYYITKSIIENDGKVKEFTVEQLTPSEFKINYVSTQPINDLHEANIRTEIAKYLEPGLRIKFERITVLKRSKGGKLKQFTSHVKD